MSKEKKICPNCGEEHNNSRGKYCRRIVVKECPICKEYFEQICQTKIKKLCSTKCTSIHANNVQREHKQNMPLQNCKRCGKEFRPVKKTKDGIVGCSHRCRFQLRVGKFTCKVCGEEYWPTFENSTVCSAKCSGKAAQSDEAKRKRLATNLERYGVENVYQSKDIKEKIIKTNLERYGVEHVMQCSKHQKKVQETNLKKYGVKHPLQNEKVLRKVQETNLERYGNVCPLQNPEIQKKKQRTMMDKYGVPESFLSNEVLNKIKQTNIERYGHENPFGSSEIKEKVKKTNLKKYGAENYSNRDTLQQEIEERDNYAIELYKEGFSELEIADLLEFEYITIRRILLKNNIVKPNNISEINKYWVHIIKSKLNIEFKHEGKIFTNRRMSVDLYNDEFNIAIDINPTITHSTQETPFPNRKPAAVKYHQKRGLDANKNGWKLIQIFDWDNEEDILELLKIKLDINEKIPVEKCVLKEISIPMNNMTSKKFVCENNKSREEGNISIQYGLYHEGELVQVMNFSKDGLEDGHYELLNLGSKKGITIVDGANRLFNEFISSSYKPKSIKTFVNFSRYSGEFYENLGMKHEGFAELEAYYSNILTNEVHKLSEIPSKYQKEYSKLGLTQKEYMNSNGFYKINDAGHKIYSWGR